MHTSKQKLVQKAWNTPSPMCWSPIRKHFMCVTFATTPSVNCAVGDVERFERVALWPANLSHMPLRPCVHKFCPSNSTKIQLNSSTKVAAFLSKRKTTVEAFHVGPHVKLAFTKFTAAFQMEDRSVQMLLKFCCNDPLYVRSLQLMLDIYDLAWSAVSRHPLPMCSSHGK